MSATFCASAVWDAAGASSHTFTAQPIGTAATDRLVIVSVSAKGTAVALSSVTIGGITATVHRSKANSAADYRAAIMSAVVPSGTTADVVVTFAAGINRAGIGVWTVNGATATGQFAESADASVAALTVTTTTGDSVIAAVALEVTSQTGAGTAWSGATEDFDESIASLTRHSGADVDATGASTAITATQANYVRGAAVAVAFAVPPPPPDTRPATNVRIEVAFTTTPDDPVPAFRDLTSRLDRAAGIDIARGRQDEYGSVQPGRCSYVLDNTDGELTAGRSTSSFYPNVKPSRRTRVTYRNPTVSGNLLAAEAASFEGGTVGGWVSGGSGGPTLANSSTRAVDGTKSLLVTWQAGAFPFAEVVSTSLVIGRTYIFSASAYVPAGSPAVRLAVDATLIGTATTVTGAWQRISGTFTATAVPQHLQIWPTSSPTTGQQVWVDAVMIDEGTTLNTFTTTAAPIEYRFDGYVEEWPTEWPGGNKYTQARITAVDILARLGSKREMQSVVQEAIMAYSPALVYPLGEPEGSTTAADTTGKNPNLMSIAAVGGGGGTLTFGTGIGPPSDGLPAPQFAPTSATVGYRLEAVTPVVGIFEVTLRINLLTSTLRSMTAVRLADAYDNYIEIGLNGTGQPTAAGWDSWSSVNTFTLTGTGSRADGNTHDLALTLSQSGATVTTNLYEGSSLLATGSYTSAFTYLPTFTKIYVGGGRKDKLFTGTLAYPAVFNTALSSTALGVIEGATTNGYAGERSDQRISRLATWAGIPTSRQVLDVGESTSISAIDTTGKKALDVMQIVADTEQGVLFADTQGRLVFYSRARIYSEQPVVASVDAHDVSADTSPRMNKADLVNYMTAKRIDGTDQVWIDSDSITEHGKCPDSAEVAVTTDDEALGFAQWRVELYSQPSVRVPDVEIDAMTNTAIQAQVWALDIGSRLQVTSAPTQAATSTWDLVVQGYRELISQSGWTVTANTTTYGQIHGLRLNDPVYSRIDSTNRLVY